MSVSSRIEFGADQQVDRVREWKFALANRQEVEITTREILRGVFGRDQGAPDEQLARATARALGLDVPAADPSREAYGG